MPDHNALAERTAEARHAQQRLALYQQRVDTGRGDLRRLAELQRIAEGATRRLHLERDGSRKVETTADLLEALRDVNAQLETPNLDPATRKRLLQHQAALGDLRDETASRQRRDNAQSA